MNCPRCQKELPIDVSTCSACGFSFDDATQPLESPKTPPSKSSGKQSFTSFDSIDDARFVPRTVLAERYRIVGLLGRGGWVMHQLLLTVTGKRTVNLVESPAPSTEGRDRRRTGVQGLFVRH